MLPRFLPDLSSTAKFESAKATRFSKLGWKLGSSSRLRDFQNLSTNAARSASVAAAAHPAFSASVISHTTGPSPHVELTASLLFAGAWNSA